MKSFSLPIVTTALLLLSASTTLGQSIQRVSYDAGSGCAPDGCTVPAEPDCCCPITEGCGPASEGCVRTGGCVGYQASNWNSGCNSGWCGNGGGYGNCQSGSCMNGGSCFGNGCFSNGCNGSGCFNGPGLCYDPHSNCPGGMCASNNGCLTNCCLGRLCAGKAYPDAGWAPPAHLPVNRDRVWYANYHPQAFYGNAGGGFIANYPQVYQPNDTTQLGYSYQIVPTWQSRPGMIPPTPYPSQFHTRTCPSGNCFGGVNNYNYNCQPTGPQMAVQRPQIVRPQIASQSQFGGGRGLFRLSSLRNLLD